MAPKKKITIQQARQAKEKVLEMLSEQPELVGVGIAPTPEGYKVSVHLSQALPDGVIPEKEENVPVKVEIVGEICAI